MSESLLGAQPLPKVNECIRNKVSKYGRIVEKRLYYDSRRPTEFSAPRSELDLSGFTLVDCPSRNRKETLDKKLIVDVLCFAWERVSMGAVPCIVLITSDGDYSYALARLRDIGVFTVIIYKPEVVAKVLIDNSNVVMSWEYDVLGGPPERQYDNENEEGDLEMMDPPDAGSLGISIEDNNIAKGLLDQTSIENQGTLDEKDTGNMALCDENSVLEESQTGTDLSSPIDSETHIVPNDAPNDATKALLSILFDTKPDRNFEEINQQDTEPSHSLDDPENSYVLDAQVKQQEIPEPKMTAAPNLQSKEKFAMFCTVVLNNQYRNVQEGVNVYASWADEGYTAEKFYLKLGEKDRKGYREIRQMATEKGFIEWGRRNLTTAGKPVIKVRDRDDRKAGLSSEAYARLTYAGLAVLNTDVPDSEGAWNLVAPKTQQDRPSQNKSADVISSSGPIATKIKSTLFVGGLAWQTTEDSLSSYFKQYGRLQGVNVVHGRGFGFVKFKNVEDAKDVLIKRGNHIIDNHIVE